MLLVIDVGNTNIVIGVYRGDSLLQNWRIRTERNATEDEFHVLVSGLFARENFSFKDIRKTVISCVVPPVVTVLEDFCRKYLK
ncbi:MAG: type III pantothenate kinase, partial [Desulfosarcinaceae bacterium]